MDSLAPVGSHRSGKTSTDYVSYLEDADRPSIRPTVASSRRRGLEDGIPFLPSDVDPQRQRPPLSHLDMPSREELIRELKRELVETYPEHVKAEAWEKTANVVKTYSDEMVDRWNREIDALLTYAGLFSAVLTAFNVQSYQLLQPPSTDPTMAALSQISAQLASFSANPSFVNSTQLAFSPSALFPTRFKAPQYAVWLNICWFASLVFSLAAASVGIMVKQWLNKYSVGLSGTSREIAALRQHRLNRLHRWRVPMIVAMLPVLLQTALALFLVGLVILLWSIHVTVAVVVAVLVGVLLAFTLCTTVLPAFREDCCYLSPQAFGVFFVREKVRWAGRRLLERLTDRAEDLVYSLSFHTPWYPLRRLLYRTRERLVSMHTGLSITGPSTWLAHEQVLVTRSSAALEGDMMASAYSTTMDAGCFDAAAACLVDHDHLAAVRYHDTVLHVLSAHWGSREAWPLSALDSYVQLAGRVLQSTLTATPPYEWGEAAGLLVLMRDLPPDVFESLDLHGLMRSYTVLAMGRGHESKEAFRFLFRTLEPRTSWRRPYRGKTLWFVAAAAAYRIDAFRAPRLGAADDLRLALDLALDDYSDAVRLAIRCIARPIVADVSEQPNKIATGTMAGTTPAVNMHMHAVQECVRAVLAAFLRFLQTPVWRRMCREAYASAAFRTIVEDVQHLSRFAHSRCFVTDEFLQALTDGLEEVAEAELVGGGAAAEERRMEDVLICHVLIGALQVH